MATAKYKAVKDYTEDEVHVAIGHVFVLDTKDAQPDVERGRLVLQKYLDPEDENDAAEIAHFEGNPTGAKKPRVKAPKKENTNETAPAAPKKKSAPKKVAAKKTAPKK